ncbi:MAG: UDP-N-acetylmuramoyl-L-alanyl-D-glutamate--2,6-diaminopimelate ligase [Alistipes sp.]|nr:UDP-N-acetylmuramoyl-L-alanyl-D-glutamate--2,6-diaminopimelate ligase [Alistipes sp.]MBQ6581082.1 UDP-N-acetylmuramoyl-L-alanyl-D-glutamate--2,6-diaminopimelate ligase [Alistipes sp.]
MKHLSEILSSTEVISFSATEDHTITGLTYDSRTVTDGNCFFAVRGTQSDGHDYIPRAVEAGAVAVVCEQEPEKKSDGVSYIVVADTNKAMADMAAAYYDHPSRELHLVGVTGTNGKTTIATLLYDLYRRMGYRAGLISTVVYRIDTREIPSTHTTPDAIRLNAMLREMVDCGCDYCFMEVSSHSLVQDRVRGLKFRGALFTNLTHDHLDYHGTYAEYIKAKKLLFDRLDKQAFALVNVDDRNGEVMVQNCRAHVVRYSLRQMADYRAKVLEMLFDGMLLRIDSEEVWVSFLGRFNAYNLLCVYGAAVEMGADKGEVLQALSALHSVSGRFEPIRSDGGITAIVDYAHTPDALENVIATINDIRCGGARLFVVCGCGGDRDPSKREAMGRIASREADVAIFTSDNPRTEDPEHILDQIMQGVEAGRQTLRITDRSQAIRTAVMMAAEGDIILVAGKGHEDYQIIGREKIHFDDREQVRAAFDDLHK